MITVNNHSGQLFTDVSVVDRFPAGFSYIKGSALLDGVPTEPSVAGLTLSWNGLTIAGTQVRTVKVLFVVGAGVTDGEFVNRAQAFWGPISSNLTRFENSSNWPITSRNSASRSSSPARRWHSLSSLARRSLAANTLGSNSDFSSKPSSRLRLFAQEKLVSLSLRSFRSLRRSRKVNARRSPAEWL